MESFEREVITRLSRIEAKQDATADRLRIHEESDEREFHDIRQDLGQLQVDAAVAKRTGTRRGAAAGATVSGVVFGALEGIRTWLAGS